MADRPSEIRFASLIAGAPGNYVLVAGSAGYVVELLGAVISASAPLTATFYDATGNLGAAYLGANAPVVLPISLHGWLKTRDGEALGINVGVGGNASCGITYRLMPSHAGWE